MSDIFELRSTALPDGTEFVAFHGVERISAPYHYAIFASIPSNSAELTEAVGLKATLSVHYGSAPYDIHGIIVAAELVQEVAERALVRIDVVPRLWQLGIDRHSRVFTKKSAPDVIRAVLEEAGLSGEDVEFRLGGSYSPEEHVCQYKESDLAFISRWMEYEGLYYYFEQGESSEKLIITDRKSFHAPMQRGPVRYHPVTEKDVSAEESFASFIGRQRVLPSLVKRKDYNYAKPNLDISGEAQVAEDGPLAEVVLHGERFFTPERGKQLAQIRAEELLARQKVFEGRGMVFHLRTGYLFELTEHPRSSVDGEYLCIALEHRGNLRAKTPELRALVGIEDDETYYVKSTAIPSSVQFRAKRETPWPRVDGTEHALIDGPAGGEYAELDDDGRYNVKFAFDEGTLSGGKASTAVRMMQPHAGNPEGFHFPLRKGTEVLVAFLAGDPDRPVIAGAVPNAQTPSPVTSSNATKNIIHTGSDNHIEIEDEAGKQWIDLKTPPKKTYLHLGQPHDGHTHFIVANTEGDCLFNIGSNQDIVVGGNLTEKVTGAVKETYNTSQTSDVKGPQTTIVDGAVEEKYTAGGHSTTTTGLVMELYQAGQKTTVSGGGRNETYNVGHTSIVHGGVTQIYQTGQTLLQTGQSTQKYDGTFSSTATGVVTLNYDGAVTQDYGETTGTYGTVNWNVPGGADIYTSEWKVTMTDASFITNIINELKLSVTEATVLSLAIIGVKLEFLGLSLATNVLKIERNGCTLTGYGAKIDLNSIKLDTKPADVSKAGITGK